MRPRILFALIWTVLILVACLIPQSWMDSGGTSGGSSWLDRMLGPLPADKVVHGGLFAVFALFWRWAGVSTKRTLMGGLVLAVVSELGQSIPVLKRTTDVADLLADLAGMGIVLLICRPRRSRSEVVAEPV